MPTRRAHLASGDSATTVSPGATVFVWGTVAAGAGALALNLLDLTAAGNWTDLAPFLILAVVAERMSVETYTVSQERISLSFGIAVAMAAAAALPHGAALVAIPLGATISLQVGQLVNLAMPVALMAAMTV